MVARLKVINCETRPCHTPLDPGFSGSRETTHRRFLHWNSAGLRTFKFRYGVNKVSDFLLLAVQDLNSYSVYLPDDFSREML